MWICRYRQFYLAYPQIRETLSPELGIAAGSVLTKLSFSHIVELLTCTDPIQRAFYELECIRGNWTVRELKRQINTYVSWYRKNMTTDGDNPPVGILLCTQKDQALVEYAMAGIDNELFVSKYQLELPKKEDMQRFIEEQLSRSLS